MAQNQTAQESLDQFIRRNLRIYVMMNSFYYTIKNPILNKLFEKFIYDTQCYLEEYRQLKRLNLCRNILQNPRLIFSNDIVNRLMTFCPNDNWRLLIGFEFEEYKTNAPIELKQLTKLKNATFGQLWKSYVYDMFHKEIIHQTKHIRDLLRDIYTEFHANV